MPVINIIIILALIGIGMWVINRYLPIEEPWKKVLNIVAVIATVLWLLKVLGIYDIRSLSGTASTCYNMLRSGIRSFWS